VNENIPGLDFIKLLRPVTYNYNVDKENEILGIKDTTHNKDRYEIEKIKFSGFIAQEVDDAAKKIGYNFSGVDKNGPLWGLKYSEFTVPLVKAVQELNTKNIELQNTIDNLQKQIDELKTLINK